MHVKSEFPDTEPTAQVDEPANPGIPRARQSSVARPAPFDLKKVRVYKCMLPEDGFSEPVSVIRARDAIQLRNEFKRLTRELKTYFAERDRLAAEVSSMRDEWDEHEVRAVHAERREAALRAALEKIAYPTTKGNWKDSRDATYFIRIALDALRGAK